MMSCSIIKEVYKEVLYYPVAEQCGYRVLELYALNLMFVFFFVDVPFICRQQQCREAHHIMYCT